jgi:hypothetical protein
VGESNSTLSELNTPQFKLGTSGIFEKRKKVKNIIKHIDINLENKKKTIP